MRVQASYQNSRILIINAAANAFYSNCQVIDWTRKVSRWQRVRRSWQEAQGLERQHEVDAHRAGVWRWGPVSCYGPNVCVPPKILRVKL